jgi:hypothetical protein
VGVTNDDNVRVVTDPVRERKRDTACELIVQCHLRGGHRERIEFSINLSHPDRMRVAQHTVLAVCRNDLSQQPSCGIGKIPLLGIPSLEGPFVRPCRKKAWKISCWTLRVLHYETVLKLYGNFRAAAARSFRGTYALPSHKIDFAEAPVRK